jgi:hypothetical protein
MVETNNDKIMEALFQIKGDVGEIKGQVGAFIKQMEAHDNRTTELEVRTRKVEGRQHYYSGAGAILGAVLGALGVHVRTP